MTGIKKNLAGGLQATRGFGLLENFLAKKRAQKANRLISANTRSGRILDLGCGTNPLFLLNTDFKEKYGLEKEKCSHQYFTGQDMSFIHCDIEKNHDLPFPDNFFNIVTILAVLEHLELQKVVVIFKELYRILKPAGMLIITTPADWTSNLLKVLSWLKMVSSIEINEHKSAYDLSKIYYLLNQAGFESRKIKQGHFEVFMNIWTTAEK